MRVPDDDLTGVRLGLDPGARVLVNSFRGGGTLDMRDVERVYGDRCDVVLVAVPPGEGVIFETALQRALFAVETETAA